MTNNDNLNKNTIKLVQEQNINSLPHDEEAEEVLLGNLLSDNTALDLIENGFKFSLLCSNIWKNLSKYL